MAELLARSSSSPHHTTTTTTNSSCLSLEEYLVWTVEAPLARDFARLVFELCHVVLGLRPASRRHEADIVRGWLEREEALGLCPGQVPYRTVGWRSLFWGSGSNMMKFSC